MRHFLTLRRVLTVGALMLAWCALWGELSAANVASGLIVAIVVSGSRIGTSAQGGIRLGPLLTLGKLVLVDLFVSTVSVAREVITPTDYTDEAIIAVEVPGASRNHLLLLTVAITVTPGTAVVDADPDRDTLYLHVLHAERRQGIETHVQDLAELACRALPNEAHPNSRSRT